MPTFRILLQWLPPACLHPRVVSGIFYVILALLLNWHPMESEFQVALSRPMAYFPFSHPHKNLMRHYNYTMIQQQYKKKIVQISGCNRTQR